MIAQLGPLVTALAGSMQGTTFQRSRVGTLIRKRPIGIRRRTLYTNTERTRWQYLTRNWRALTAGQRTDWQSAATALSWVNKFGEPIRGLGYWLYLQVNGYRAALELAALDTVGTISAVGSITTPTATYNVAAGWIKLDALEAAVPAADVWLVYATPPLSAGRSAPFSAYRYIGNIPATSALPFDVFTMYTTRFPELPTPADAVYFRVQPVLDAWQLPGAPIEVQLAYI